ncbi:beta-D-glucosyl crocetin beta-1,6-glucosyltransferase-like [Camellia sinensis]|uniref:beta-D-glucosyl crocetin beta-1,6-glucosyltransferase-like n=1 Tax=Camellia sinensis TaxID=4442 RepID=UPI0010367876|nr:beta-D-glucosyl crocetin beta-1,6-glucosyltransferase-like [Camellia sinensis]
MEEMAHGLELSNVNFIWVVRFPVGQKTRVEEALPKGFLERVGGRGLVIQGWAPQVKILENPNVGGFVSHCGWSSVMEGIKFGVPIISVPMHLDQPINARLLSEIGVGVEIMRDDNGKILREEVAKVIKQVVMEKSGEAVKKKERELMVASGGGGWWLVVVSGCLVVVAGGGGGWAVGGGDERR